MNHAAPGAMKSLLTVETHMRVFWARSWHLHCRCRRRRGFNPFRRVSGLKRFRRTARQSTSESVARGSAIVMLHGFGDTGDMWAPLTAQLAHDHTVIVPDLRGMGLSSHPEGGYDKKTQAGDIARVLDSLKVQKTDLVIHDIGNMVGYAFAAQYPDRVTRFVVMDAPLPGIGPWDEIIRSPALWHLNFRGPDVERLVKGRERIYLDRIWNEL
jgi:pimeloyl-ACP methyl ester carboxylesterase